MGFATDLPDFPWDALTPYKAAASRHPGGLVDLSVGTPTDPTPHLARAALAAAAEAPGYPPTHGTPALRQAVARWFARTRSVPHLDEAGVLPTIGSKEAVAHLPSLLGLGPGDIVVHPAIAYPTYDIGARLAGASTIATDEITDWRGNAAVKLVWINSPGNPHGKVAGIEELRAIVAAARQIGAVVAADECYAALTWESDEAAPSLLDPRVSDTHQDLLVAYSLSKQSNLAGYRAAFLAGDPHLIARLLELRKHIGAMMPAPVQEVMTLLLADDKHVAEQKERYRLRRRVLKAALEQAGYLIDHSEAGLYLWTRPAQPQDSWSTLADFAELGILVAPGDFYGDSGHVRIALTASDDAIADAADRLLGA